MSRNRKRAFKVKAHAEFAEKFCAQHGLRLKYRPTTYKKSAPGFKQPEKSWKRQSNRKNQWR